ncbi:unnamed protein product [Cochlearia groenlandica]
MEYLSYLFNWDHKPIQLEDCFIPDMDMIIPEPNSFFHQSQQQSLFHQPLFQEEDPSQTLLELNPKYGFGSLCDQFLPPQEISLPCPKTEIFDETYNMDCFLHTQKRQKISNSSYHYNTQNHFSSHNPNLFNPNNESLNLVPQATIFPEFRAPDSSLSFNVGLGDQETAKEPMLSSQSIAARKRRRRIVERTHELGKLIPGGQRLHTAAMFQAAAKYVKFLQSQVGILEVMETTKKMQGGSNAEIETKVLLESQAIQEKLSMEEVCLVPCEMVQALLNEESICRNPKISRELNKLLSTKLAN